MKDQVHIRNAEAAQLARTLARRTGRTISAIVLDALRQYRPARTGKDRPRRIAHWLKLLEKDRAQGRRTPEIPIEHFYDEATGLPK